jgi:hypothetical protein
MEDYAEEPDSGQVPSRESFEELAGFIIDESGYTPKEEDSRATQAAKAWVKAQDGGTELYSSVFGACPKEDCSYGANGFEATHCRKHQDASEDESESSDGDSNSDELESRVNTLEDKMDRILDAVEGN